MRDKILIVTGPANYANAIEGLGEIMTDHQDFLDNPEEYKLLMFTGGEDVSPGLYGHRSPNHMCHNNPRRDMVEEQIYKAALLHGIKMTGICRGSQFLNVMNGGWMIHHLDGHTGQKHLMEAARGDIIEVTSTHHQMSVVAGHGHIIGWSHTKRSNQYIGDNDEPIDYDGLEVEAHWYPQTNCAAVQYHPEYMERESDGYRWYHEMVSNLLSMTPEEFTEAYVFSALEDNELSIGV